MNDAYRYFVSRTTDIDFLKCRIKNVEKLKLEFEEDLELLKNRLGEIDKTNEPTPAIINMIQFDNWKDAVKFENAIKNNCARLCDYKRYNGYKDIWID